MITYLRVLSKPFEDTSVFQGIIAFQTDTGESVRAEERGNGLYHIFILEGEAYHFKAAVKISGKANPARLWSAFQKLEGSQND